MAIDEVIFLLICVFGFVVLLFSVTALVTVNTMTLDARRARALERQARLDYLNARGTAHLRMLRTAKANLEKKISQLDAEIASCRANESDLESRRADELRRALETHIVESRFREVPELGPSLRTMVIYQVFRGRLTDLKNAHRVQGIGQTRQAYISQWVDNYVSLLPELVKRDFPAKDRINDSYKREIYPIRYRRRELEAQKTILEELMGRANVEIDRLAQFKPIDFRKSLQDPNSARDGLEDYLRGCFSEWEPIPEWFRQIVEMGKANA